MMIVASCFVLRYAITLELSHFISLQTKHEIWPSKWRAENMKHHEWRMTHNILVSELVTLIMTQIRAFLLFTSHVPRLSVLKNNHYWQMMFCMWAMFREREGDLFLGQGCLCHCLHYWVLCFGRKIFVSFGLWSCAL